jgi:hypothetical protein
MARTGAAAVRRTAERGPALNTFVRLVLGAMTPQRRQALAYRAICVQCGQWEWTKVLRLGRRRSRYSCEHCGAVVTVPTAELSTDLRPATGNLAAVMPVAMVRWVSSANRRMPSLDELTRGMLYDLYRRWDAERRSDLPAFSTVVDALHDACYRHDLVVTRFGPPSDALRERVEHARRWLALRAAELSWILSRLPDGGLAVPDREAVQAALTALRTDATLDLDAGWAARAGLFGTYAGPSVEALFAVYSLAELVQALEVYVATGARPLRSDVLANLAAPTFGKSTIVLTIGDRE